jgi:hypothetical protein
MKVLFLDIDGVLNSHRSAYAFGGFPFDVDKHRNRFDEVAIALVRNICTASGAQIVLSSSWRTDKDWQRIGRGLNLPIFDRTPYLHPGPRGAEIAAWLAAHPEVDCYAILDDEGDMLAEQKPRFVQTTHEDGLTFALAGKLAALLGVTDSDVLRTVRPA